MKDPNTFAFPSSTVAKTNHDGFRLNAQSFGSLRTHAPATFQQMPLGDSWSRNEITQTAIACGTFVGVVSIPLRSEKMPIAPLFGAAERSVQFHNRQALYDKIIRT